MTDQCACGQARETVENIVSAFGKRCSPLLFVYGKRKVRLIRSAALGFFADSLSAFVEIGTPYSHRRIASGHSHLRQAGIVAHMILLT